MKLKIIVYKIIFIEIPHFYIGWHKEKKLEDGYLGSPSTFRDFWDFYTPVREIINEFEYSGAGERAAQELEKELIQRERDNPLCLNMSCGGLINSDLLSRQAKERWKDEEYRNRHSEMMKSCWEKGEFIEKMKTRDKKKSEDLKEMWNEPLYREKMTQMSVEGWMDPDRIESVKQAMIKLWGDPEYRERASESRRKSWEDPSRVLSHSQRMVEQWKDSEYREKMSRISLNRMWITDGTPEGNKLVPKGSVLPPNFRPGRTLNKRSKPNEQV